MEVKIVLGHAFGDEGKGVTVQWLCKQAIADGKRPLVVRFSGGPQAAHTIVNNGVEHICSSFGSGVLLGVPTFLDNKVFVDPICLMKEYNVLKDKGVDPKIDIDRNCRIITPYDVMAGINNGKVRKDGTCGRGIFATFDRYRQKSLINAVSKSTAEIHLTHAAHIHGFERDAELDEMFINAYGRMIELTSRFIIRPGIKTGCFINTVDYFKKDFDVIIFEGSQGLLLDMDCGFYPNVTPSKVGLNGISGCFLDNAELYLVTRTYLTRHGNGYEPKWECKYDLSKKHETNVYNEFQGVFKTGVLETSLLNQAYQRHCIDNYVAKHNMKVNLVVTHTDSVTNWVYVETKGRMDGYQRKEKTPAGAAKLIASYLDYHIDNIFYNDSVESNIKKA